MKIMIVQNMKYFLLGTMSDCHFQLIYISTVQSYRIIRHMSSCVATFIENILWQRIDGILFVIFSPLCPQDRKFKSVAIWLKKTVILDLLACTWFIILRITNTVKFQILCLSPRVVNCDKVGHRWSKSFFVRAIIFVAYLNNVDCFKSGQK